MSILEVWGATVRGPSHIARDEPNQDAWGWAKLGASRLIVASDGLGSRHNSHQGAKAAVQAVPDALRVWRRYPHAELDVLAALIRILWRARLGTLEPKSCACTCLFALLEPDGSGWVGQLGDGATLVVQSTGEVEMIKQRPEEAFGNETAALGTSAAQFAFWTFKRLDPGTCGVVLCTDGVADDLLPEHLGAWVEWLRSTIGARAPRSRTAALARELADWPTPGHIDDKTISAVFRAR